MLKYDKHFTIDNTSGYSLLELDIANSKLEEFMRVVTNIDREQILSHFSDRVLLEMDGIKYTGGVYQAPVKWLEINEIRDLLTTED